mmetsp:Transcript_5531/g.13975  ORF Transcript_5531/g.13975 Transcript_5531/m.13975 type:complete len:232 (-) Transcript_5531:504-1199(-)
MGAQLVLLRSGDILGVRVQDGCRIADNRVGTGVQHRTTFFGGELLQCLSTLTSTIGRSLWRKVHQLDCTGTIGEESTDKLAFQHVQHHVGSEATRNHNIRNATVDRTHGSLNLGIHTTTTNHRLGTDVDLHARAVGVHHFRVAGTGRCGTETFDVGEEKNEIGVDGLSDQTGETVVVPEDLVLLITDRSAARTHGIVLVDHWNHTILQKLIEGGNQCVAAAGHRKVAVEQQ